jgi:hypothetical protein
VPQDQREESYFAPLAELAADSDTELNFALVPYHPADQAPGATGEQVRLIDGALAESHGGSRAWIISTECGLCRCQAGRYSKDYRTCTARSSLGSNGYDCEED